MFLFIDFAEFTGGNYLQFKYILCSYLSRREFQIPPFFPEFKYILCSYLSNAGKLNKDTGK